MDIDIEDFVSAGLLGFAAATFGTALGVVLSSLIFTIFGREDISFKANEIFRNNFNSIIGVIPGLIGAGRAIFTTLGGKGAGESAFRVFVYTIRSSFIVSIVFTILFVR